MHQPLLLLHLLFLALKPCSWCFLVLPLSSVFNCDAITFQQVTVNNKQQVTLKKKKVSLPDNLTSGAFQQLLQRNIVNQSPYFWFYQEEKYIYIAKICLTSKFGNLVIFSMTICTSNCRKLNFVNIDHKTEYFGPIFFFISFGAVRIKS